MLTAQQTKTNPQSDVQGVIFSKKHKKWIGRVRELVPVNPKYTTRRISTKYFESKIECENETEILRIKCEERFWKRSYELVEADPHLRGLPLGPSDAADAPQRVVFWRPCRLNSYEPKRVVSICSPRKSGAQWVRACALCPNVKCQQGSNGIFCKRHSNQNESSDDDSISTIDQSLIDDAFDALVKDNENIDKFLLGEIERWIGEDAQCKS